MNHALEQQPESQWPIEVYKLLVSFVAAACLVMAFVVAKNEREFLVSLLGTMCLVVVSIPLFTQRPISVFEPIMLVNLLVLIGIPVKLIYILWVRKTDEFVAEHVLLQQDPEVFLYGTFVLFVGYSLFVVGYTLKLPRFTLAPIMLPNVTQWNGRRLQIAILVIAGISLVSFAGYIVTTGVSFSSFTDISQKRFLESRESGGERMHSVGYLFCRGAAFSKFLVYFCLIWIIHRKKSFFSWTGALLVASALQSILLAVSLNSRAGVALLLLDCAILSYYLFNRINVKLLISFLCVASLLMVAMMYARGEQNNRNTNTVERLLQKTLSGRNMLDISKCCHIINGVPKKMGYRGGEMMYAWLAAPVPSSYWPNKPVWSNQGVIVNQKIFGYRGDISGCPPSIIGELQWNFGPGGIWVGLFVAGLVFRQIFLAFYAHRHNPTSILLYTMILTRFIMFSLGNDLGTGIVKAGLDLVPVYAILVFVGMVESPQSARTYEPQPKSRAFSGQSKAEVMQ